MGKSIFFLPGATGNLAALKLYPALDRLMSDGLIPDMRLVGIALEDLNETSYRSYIREKTGICFKDTDYIQEDFNSESFDKIRKYVAEIPEGTDIYFYLAVSPVYFEKFINEIAFMERTTGHKINFLIEKPYGPDYETTVKINRFIKDNMDEQRCRRIDHYLGKPGYSELLEWKEKLKDRWNGNYIDEVSVVMTETVGIEERLDFYRETGAIADAVQNHVFQMLMGVISDISGNKAENTENAEIFASLIRDMADEKAFFKAGQYFDFETATMIYGTFVSEHPDWRNVKFNLIFGKKMDRKETSVTVHFKDEKDALVIDFTKSSPEALPEYALLIKNFIEGSNTFFLSAKESENTWIFGDSLRRILSETGGKTIRRYAEDTTTLNDVISWINLKR